MDRVISDKEHVLEPKRIDQPHVTTLEACTDNESIQAYFKESAMQGEQTDLANELVVNSDTSLLAKKDFDAGVRVGIQAVQGKKGKFFSLRRFLDVDDTRCVDQSWIVREGDSAYKNIASMHAELLKLEAERQTTMTPIRMAVKFTMDQREERKEAA